MKRSFQPTPADAPSLVLEQPHPQSQPVAPLVQLLAVLLVLSMALPAMAIRPQQWSDSSEADFMEGQTDQTVVTSLGDVKLAASLEVVGEMPEEVSILYDLARLDDGALYMAAGPEGKLLRMVDEQVSIVAELEDEQIFTLLAHENRLLVGISGEHSSRVAVLEDDQLTTLVAVPDVRYIWDMLVPHGWENRPGEHLVLATGPDGRLLLVTRDGDEEPEIHELFKAHQANLLCLAGDPRGTLFVGTDTDGLIYRVRPDGEEGFDIFVVYDASEPEIATLALTADGVLYAGTADAQQARPGRMERPRTESAGRREQAGDPDAPPAGPEDPPADDPAEGPDAPEDIPGVPPAPEDMATPATAADDSEQSSNASDTRQTQEVTPDGSEARQEMPSGDTDATSTPEQRDRLRARVKDMLQAARDSGDMNVPAGDRPEQPAAGQTASRPRPVQGQGAARQGNAIYRIDPDGFVSEVFRESVMILRLQVLADGKTLIASTGNEGQIYRIHPGEEEHAVLAKLEGQQIPALLLVGDADEKGPMLFGTANPAQLVRLTDQVAAEGSFTSRRFDARQISLLGTVALTADIPQDTRIRLETRSGNVEDPEQAPWSPWSEATLLDADPEHPAMMPRSVRIESPPARFFQYRLTLEGHDHRTPVVHQAEMTYVMPNLRPVISTLKATYPESRGNPQQATDELPAAATRMNIQWQASDPNDDRLLYNLAYRPAASQRWLTLAEDLTGNSHEWETRRVPDGWYVIRLTASDRLDNPADMALQATRLSDPVLVDNTPPTFHDLQVRQSGPGQLSVQGTVRDRLSPIAALAYTINDQKTYEQIIPDDLIFDSTSESWRVTISDLSPGPQVLTLRAVDRRGNVAYHAVMLDLEPDTNASRTSR